MMRMMIVLIGCVVREWDSDEGEGVQKMRKTLFDMIYG